MICVGVWLPESFWWEGILVSCWFQVTLLFFHAVGVLWGVVFDSYPNGGWKTDVPPLPLFHIAATVVETRLPLCGRETLPPNLPPRLSNLVGSTPTPSHLRNSRSQDWEGRFFISGLLQILWNCASEQHQQNLLHLIYFGDSRINESARLSLCGLMVWKREVQDPNVLLSEKPSMGPNELEKRDSL